MKFKLERNNNFKLKNYKLDIDGLNIKPINKVSNQNIKVNEIILTDNSLINSYIKKRLNKKINRIVNFMISIINDMDADTDEDSGMALDEVNKLKGIIEIKYKKYMSINDYRSYISKLNIIEEEFNKNYNQKMYMDCLSGNYYEEEVISSRGR